MRRDSPFVLVLLVLGSFFVTYNLVTVVIHKGWLSWDDWSDNDLESRMFMDFISEILENAKRPNEGRMPFHLALKAADFGEFTTALHSQRSDDLVDDIPVLFMDQLQAGLHQDHIVLNRPWAPFEEEYVLMAEPGHILLRPLPNLALRRLPAAFPFFNNELSENEKILIKNSREDNGLVTKSDQ